MSNQQPRVAVITGASAGIGKSAAKTLVADGWKVIGIGRTPERATDAEREIADAAAKGGSITMLLADMALLAEADRVADEIIALTDRIDLLANNAGGMAQEARLTREGLEANFTGNHLAPFHLTERLLPLLKRAATDAPQGAVRIVNTSSDGSEMIPTLDVDAMGAMESLPAGAIYCSGKLANVMHARMLGERLADDNIVAHSFHPGTVGSNFFTHVSQDVRDRYTDMTMLTPEEGADTLLWLATSEEAGRRTGLYWHKREVRDPNPVVEDAGLLKRMWDKSRELVSNALDAQAAKG